MLTLGISHFCLQSFAPHIDEFLSLYFCLIYLVLAAIPKQRAPLLPTPEAPILPSPTFAYPPQPPALYAQQQPPTSTTGNSTHSSPSPNARSPKFSQSPKSMFPVVPSRVGRESDDGQGVVVWTGHLANGNSNLCEVDMLAYGQSIKPALL